MNLPSFLKFGKKRDKQDERLMELFSNRVELKKEFARLREERLQLEEKLVRREGEAARLKQKLEYLEGQLTDKNTAASTVVFYQLRGLWRRCAKRLLTLSTQMAKQISDKREAQAIAKWNAEHAKKVAVLDQQLVDEKTEIIEQKQSVRTTIETLKTKDKAWHFFSRRKLEKERDRFSDALKQQLIAHNVTLERRKQLETARAPEVETLTLDDKRMINLTVIAMAQFLHAHFDEYMLSSKAKAAMAKHLGSIDYGSEEECEKIHSSLRLAFDSLMKLEKGPEFFAHTRRQASHLASIATYSSDTATRPEPFLAAPDAQGSDDIDGLVISEYFSPPAAVMKPDFWTMSEATLS